MENHDHRSGRHGGSVLNPDLLNADSVNNDWYTSETGGLANALSKASAGDTVVFDADETISKTITLKSGVDIEGRNGAVLRLADGADADLLGVGGISDVTIEGMILDGNKANQSAAGRGIRTLSAGGITNLTVRDCTIKNCRLDCITIQEDTASTTEDVTVVDNTFLDYGAHGAVLGTDTDAGATIRNCTLRGNTCRTPNSDPTGIALTFYRVTGTCTNNSINDNTIETTSANAHDAITFEGPTDCEAVGNQIDTDSNALNATNGSTGILFGDNVVEATGRAVRIAETGTSDIVVDGGSFVAGASSGVLVEKSATDVKLSDFRLTLTSSDYGIHILNDADAGDFSISNVTVDGSISLFGIWVRVPSATVDNCTVTDAARSGLRVGADDCTVTGGKYYGNGSSGTQPYGVWLDGVTDCTVTGIRAYAPGNNQEYGVAGSSSDYNAVVANGLRGNNTGATTGLGANSAVANNVK